MDAGRFLQGGVMATFPQLQGSYRTLELLFISTWWNTFFLWSICYGCMNNWLFAYPKDYFQGLTMGLKVYYPMFGICHNSLESLFLV